MNIKLHHKTILLKEIFTISRGSYTKREVLIVELIQDRNSGYGEASEHAYYGVSIDALLTRAEELKPIIEGHQFTHPENLWNFLQPLLSDLPFLLCALDNAAHDLYGKLREQPCHKLWGLDTTDMIKSSYTLSIAPLPDMIAKLASLQFDTYKIKLGFENDMEVVRALRKHTEATFTIDANCGWTVAETIKNSEELRELRVDFIEQPLAAADWEGMKKVKAQSALPVIADESCRGESDLAICGKHFDGINIKLMKCGGITPALRMIAKARSLDLKLMLGCMVESSVGISAIAQLVPHLDFVDMDGALLISNDPASGALVCSDGSLKLPKGNGLGITMLE